MTIDFYEKPGCGGNARQKKLLVEAGCRLVVHDLLLTKWERDDLLGYFDEKPVAEWFNPFAPAIKEGSINPKAFGANEAIELMIADPILIRRPLMRAWNMKMSGFDKDEIAQKFGIRVDSAPPTCQSGDSCRTLEAWLKTHDFVVDELNRRYKNGDTPLIVAAREGNEEIVKALLEAKADVNVLNEDFNGAFWFACRGGFAHIAALLLDAWANIDNQNANGATALILAASVGNEELVKLLLGRGANKNLSTLDGFNAMESASTPAIMKLLK